MIKSIGHPEEYEPNSNCKWTIQAPPEGDGAFLHLHFEVIDVSQSFLQ